MVLSGTALYRLITIEVMPLSQKDHGDSRSQKAQKDLAKEISLKSELTWILQWILSVGMQPSSSCSLASVKAA